jgi:hypothetical protein
MTRGWIEEAGEWREDAKNNIAASIGRWKNKEYNLPGKLLMTCNPSKNFLYDYYKKHKEGQLEPHECFIQAFPSDNKRTQPGYLEHLHRTLSPYEKQRLLYGNWEYDDDPTIMCRYDAIKDCFTNTHVIPNMTQKRLSADLAMQGRDRFVVCYWKGSAVEIVIDKKKATGKEIEQDLQKAMNDFGVPRSQVVADSDGMGAYLSSYLTGTKTFHAVTRANDPQYANLKAECAFKLAEKINRGELYIECRDNDELKSRIIAELSVLKMKSITGEEKRNIIKKDDMKELLGHSPDYLDALLMGMYFEVQSKPYLIYNGLNNKTPPPNWSDISNYLDPDEENT